MNSANLRLISSEHCLRTKLNKLGTHSSSECTISYSGKEFGTTRIRQTGLAEACAKSNYQDILCICMIMSLSLIIGPHLASSLSHCIPNLASPARPNEIDVGDVPEGASTGCHRLQAFSPVLEIYEIDQRKLQAINQNESKLHPDGNK